MKSNHSIHLGGQAFVMGGNQRRAALTPNQAQKLRKNGLRGMLIEIARRLVRQHQWRLVGEGSGNRDPLLLTAGELGRAMLEPLREAERAKQLLRPRPRSLRLRAAHELRQDDILDSVELGQQVMELIHEAKQLTPKAGAALIVEISRLFAREPDRTFEAAFEQAHSLKQSRFT